jgi:hypothetical protein
MDADAARALLGVGAGATRAELRAAYRDRLRAAHPDVVGHDAGTADVVAAFRALRDLPAPEPAAAVVVRGDTVVADLPPGDLFSLLAEAAEVVGEVAYADPAAGLLEVVAHLHGFGACSVVLTLEGSTAWCTAEPLGTGPAPEPVVVAALLAEGLRRVAEP